VRQGKSRGDGTRKGSEKLMIRETALRVAGDTGLGGGGQTIHPAIFLAVSAMGGSAIARARRKTPFDPRFYDRDPLLLPIAPAARALASQGDFPPIEVLDALLGTGSTVRFVASPPRARRRAAVVAAVAAPPVDYDARIVREGCVPTRARSWHDLLNALVWATFPAAKHALHARQHRAIAASVDRRARTRELDALALVDEGGVLVVSADAQALARRMRAGERGVVRGAIAAGRARALVFGHAIYETLVLGEPPPTGAAVLLEDRSGVDATFAEALADLARFTTPDELPRVHVGELRG
jgi:hypothetical protein